MGHVMQVGVRACTVPERVWPRGADNAKPATSWSASLVPLLLSGAAPPNKKKCDPSDCDISIVCRHELDQLSTRTTIKVTFLAILEAS